MFNNDDDSLKETKIVVTFSVTIYEAWSTDLTDSSSDYYIAMAEIYVQYFLSTLKSITTADVTSANDIAYSTCRVVSFSQSISRRKRSTDDTESEIDTEFEVIYDVLADADSSTTSGISTTTANEITSQIESSVEDALQELVELTDEDNHEAGSTNFLSEPDVTESEYEDAILSEVSYAVLMRYVNIFSLQQHILPPMKQLLRL